MELRKSDWWKAAQDGFQAATSKNGWNARKAGGALVTLIILMLILFWRKPAEEAVEEMAVVIYSLAALVATACLIILYNIWLAPMHLYRAKQTLWMKELDGRASANNALAIELADLTSKPSVGRVQEILNKLIAKGQLLEIELQRDFQEYNTSRVWWWSAQCGGIFAALVTDRFTLELLRNDGHSTTDAKYLSRRIIQLSAFVDRLELQHIKTRPNYKAAEEMINWPFVQPSGIGQSVGQESGTESLHSSGDSLPDALPPVASGGPTSYLSS
jgi:hypothetical protein